MGGNFEFVTKQNISISVNNTLEFVNGTTWRALGTGTNGPVMRMRRDKCGNLYAGGAFTIAGGVETGPIAKWDPITRIWSKLTDARIFWYNGAYVNDFSLTDCNVNCLCSFWIGGKFTVQTPDGTSFGINIIKWDASVAKWDLLGGGTRETQQGEVNTVYKKDTGANLMNDYLWIAGSFHGSFSRFTISTRAWVLSPEITDIKGTIYDMYYKSEQYYEMDKIYMVGDFSVNFAACGPKIEGKAWICPTECINACQFNIKTGEFVKMGAVNTMPTAIFTASWSNSSILVGGNVLNSSFLMKKFYLPTMTGTWNSLVSPAFPSPSYVKAIDSCDSFGCQVGSFSVGGAKGVLRYFNSTQWLNFADGPNSVEGDINTIVSYSNGISRLFLSLACIILVIVNVFIL